jgi:hypothetical protein
MKESIVFIKSLVFCNLFNAFYRKKLLANAINIKKLAARSGSWTVRPLGFYNKGVGAGLKPALTGLLIFEGVANLMGHDH